MISADLLSSGDAARALGISKMTLLRAARRGEIVPTLRTPGGFLRFHPDDVSTYARRLSEWQPGPAHALADGDRPPPAGDGGHT
jgi:excisionase family DNA binding protein